MAHSKVNPSELYAWRIAIIKMQTVIKVNIKPPKVLKEFRDKTGLSQKKAAEALGVRQATISDWENGKSSARDFMAGVRFVLLAMKCGVTVDDLIMGYPDTKDEGC